MRSRCRRCLRRSAGAGARSCMCAALSHRRTLCCGLHCDRVPRGQRRSPQHMPARQAHACLNSQTNNSIHFFGEVIAALQDPSLVSSTCTTTTSGLPQWIMRADAYREARKQLVHQSECVALAWCPWLQDPTALAGNCLQNIAIGSNRKFEKLEREAAMTPEGK